MSNGSTGAAALAAHEATQGGSSWADYESDGHTYDTLRRSIGMEVLNAHLRRVSLETGVPLAAAHFAAICCGSGANEQRQLQLLENNGEVLGELHCRDYSEAMLAHVGTKLRGFRTPHTIQRLDVVRHEFDFGKSLLGASLIQCIQHFDERNPWNPNVGRVFGKIRTQLVDGGVLFVIASTPMQGKRSRWYAHACEGRMREDRNPANEHAGEWPELELTIGQLEQAGFSIDACQKLEGPYIDPEAYFGDPKLVFDERFRTAVSFFAMARRRGLLEEYDALMRSLIDSGEIDQVRDESNRWRQTIGVAYLLVARTA